MNPHHPGESISFWSVDQVMPKFDTLAHDLTTEVCVVGGGIAGLTTAYLLMREGKKVCLLEGFEIASGQTNRTSGHISNVLGTRLYDLEKFHGANGPYIVLESHREAIQKIEDIVTNEKIDCEFEYVDAYLFADDEEADEVLDREFESCLRNGISDIQSVTSIPIADFKITSALMFPKQAQFHPLKYLKRLTEILQAGEVEIFTHTMVSEVHGGNNSYVKTRSGFKVNCQSVVVATHSPVNDLLSIHTKQYAYRSYVICFRVPAGKSHKALYWDAKDPYHYLRFGRDEKGEFLIVGGEDHKTGQEIRPEQCYLELETWARQKVPFVQEVLHRWSGQIMESMDGVGFLGRSSGDRNNVYVITGDSGNGLTHATLGAMIIVDQIMDRENVWSQFYSPSRISWRALPTYIQENSNAAAQYIDWLTPKSVADLDDIAEGEGDVYRDGTQMIAAYKDEVGNTYLYSAACPHLVGIVSWNSTEKSWDCPCHGSRFDCYGKVIEGPACQDLHKVKPAVLATRSVPDFKSRVLHTPHPSETR
jgi:glycine/D-amino acid oxidase-like deaminating enzyme/nitrite reductase/ring-hydroxylating ferredoxin subunit